MHKLAIAALSFSLLAPAALAQQPEPQPEPQVGAPQQAEPPAEPPREEPQEEPRGRRGSRFGANVGVFFPSSSKTRDRFGGAWVSIGPGFGIARRASRGGRVALDFDIMRQSKNGNRALVIPIGVSYIRALGRVEERRPNIPFAGVSLLAMPAKLKSIPDGIDSGLKLGAGAAVFVGTTFGRRAFVEARYMATTRVEGFSLSGASLSAGLRF